MASSIWSILHGQFNDRHKNLPKPSWSKRKYYIFNFRQEGLFYGSNTFEFIARMLMALPRLIVHLHVLIVHLHVLAKTVFRVCMYLGISGTVDRNIFYSWAPWLILWRWLKKMILTFTLYWNCRFIMIGKKVKSGSLSHK